MLGTQEQARSFTKQGTNKDSRNSWHQQVLPPGFGQGTIEIKLRNCLSGAGIVGSIHILIMNGPAVYIDQIVEVNPAQQLTSVAKNRQHPERHRLFEWLQKSAAFGKNQRRADATNTVGYGAEIVGCRFPSDANSCHKIITRACGFIQGSGPGRINADTGS